MFKCIVACVVSFIAGAGIMMVYHNSIVAELKVKLAEMRQVTKL